MLASIPIIKPYYDALNEGRILGIKCNECGTMSWPPSVFCQNPECTSGDVDWYEMSGKGKALTLEHAPTVIVTSYIRQFSPFIKIHGVTEEGVEFDGILTGVKDSQYDELNARVPLDIKAKIVDFNDDFKTVVWELDE